MKALIGTKEYGRKKCRRTGLLCGSDFCRRSLNTNLATGLSVQQSLPGSSCSELRPISLLYHLWPGASWISRPPPVRQCRVPCAFGKVTAAFVHGLCPYLACFVSSVFVVGPASACQVCPSACVCTRVCASPSLHLSLPFSVPLSPPSRGSCL